ncbi:MAG TPA: DUF4350 domain-containing protein [Bacteroidetes bacterium]|nr:DUF4350 domain-containing protein [Bacteroidota bacterium]HIL58927.1 DUF4350 domain-containing protein [Rhodothermales bacterium]
MRSRGLYWFLFAMAAALALLLLSQEAPMDTRVRLEREGSNPFDAEVFYAMLPSLVESEVTPVGRPAYDHLADSTWTGTTYLFLTRTFAPGEAETERLLAYAARGNTVFVAAHGMDGPFFEALGTPDTTDHPLGTGWTFDWYDNGAMARLDTLRLVSPGVAGGYGFPVGVDLAEISGIDPSRSEILGVTEDGEYVTLLRIRVGEGQVVLSSAPLAFSNAALVGLGDGPAYAAGVMASVPRQPLFWDDYRKPYRQQAQTPLRYVLTAPGLKGAYWMLLALGLLFLFFRGRRWQRAVPAHAPPPNAQREFAETVGRLHFAHGDTARLAERTRRLFLDQLRTRLRMMDPDFSEDSARRAARRAGVPEEEGIALFARMRRLRRSSQPAPADLVDLDARTDRFFRHLDAETNRQRAAGPVAPTS